MCKITPSVTDLKGFGCLSFMQTIESKLRESVDCVRLYVSSLVRDPFCI